MGSTVVMVTNHQWGSGCKSRFEGLSEAKNLEDMRQNY